MMRDWSFGTRLGLGFGVSVALTVLIAVIAIVTLNDTARMYDDLLDKDGAVLAEAQHLEFLSEQRVAASRGHLLTRELQYLEEIRNVDAEFEESLKRISTLRPGIDVDPVSRANLEYQAQSGRLFELSKTATPEQVEQRFASELRPARRALSAAVGGLRARQAESLAASRKAAAAARERAVGILSGIGIAAALFAMVAGWLITRFLARQIGSAVSQVQSSSSELQAAATQQASGSKEQATSMTEITSTMSELLATSRQIAESAQRVAKLAQQTASSASSGSETVASTSGAILGIQQQVQQVVSHMLDLGKKSQQIGGVLDIVSELADQTNILAINATIEATGAGESGRRFGVVAEEIRKLADRVGGSAKEIRGLIDEVQAAVNASVMSTETGSKAVEAGAKQFSNVTASFERIASLVTTTTEASREIELSTKQQSTAVEQVNIAIANAAQATKETEASSTQTLQTAAQLTNLSTELLRVVQPRAAN